MQNTQTFYLKILSFSLIVSLIVTFIFGGILFGDKQSLIKIEERTSRIELERTVEKIISPYKNCNKSLVGLQIPEAGEFTDMNALTYSNGNIAFKSNTNSNSLYVEQIRLKNIDKDLSDSKVLIEISLPIRSKADSLVKLKTITTRVQVAKDSADRVANCD